MEKQATLSLLAVLLLTVPDLCFAQDEMAYYKIGGELTLRPSFSGKISNILWKLNGDLIVEWVDKIETIDYYDRFKGRTNLDIGSGVLVMKQMSKEDAGKYTVEINNRVHPQSFTGKEIKVVPKPDVWVQPLSCSADSDSCSLVCEKQDVDIKEAEPITYGWKEGDGSWKELKNMSISISKTDSQNTETFTCKMKNPVSEEESAPWKNVFYVPSSPTDLGSIVGGGIFGFLVVLLIAVCLVYRKKIKAWLTKNPTEEGSGTVNGLNPGSPSDGNPEGVPLKPAS